MELCSPYVTAEAVTHKHSRVATHPHSRLPVYCRIYRQSTARSGCATLSRIGRALGQHCDSPRCWPNRPAFPWVTLRYARPASFFRSENGTTIPCRGATVVGSSLSRWTCLYRFEQKMRGLVPDGAGTVGVFGVKSSASTRIFSFGR